MLFLPLALFTLTNCHFCQQYRQIGNAVPVPLALALGKALGSVLLKLWKVEDENAREQSPEAFMDSD